MSTVPYIFANQYGNISLSELDANFANVKANVDYAAAAAQSTTSARATYVTANAQANITSVGTLTSLTVSGNITGNLVGNVTGNFAGNATGNLTGNFVGDLTGYHTGDMTGSVFADDSTVMVDAVSNQLFANSASVSTMINSGLEIFGATIHYISSNAATSNLSSDTTYNLFTANNTGYTHTINMPATASNGQLTKFTINDVPITLVEGTGNINVGFAGLAEVGNTYVYMYRSFTDSWIKTA